MAQISGAGSSGNRTSAAGAFAVSIAAGFP